MKFINPTQDAWHLMQGPDSDDGGVALRPQPQDHAILTLAQWHTLRDHWPAGLAVGVKLANDQDVEQLADDLPRLKLVVLDFPKWVDGRAYTQARLLKSRYRFQGEVRATGHVLVDMIPLLVRTGVDSVVLRADQNQAHAERALTHVTAHYQGDVNETRPWFLRAQAHGRQEG